MSTARPHELVIPATALGALHQTLAAELGAERAALALRHAGHVTGDAFFRTLDNGVEGVARIGTEEFWRRLQQLFASRGWGTLAHTPVHPGVAALESADWAEAAQVAPVTRPSCFFTTGMLANLLGQVAGDEVAVLEVECRARGDRACRFLFGSPDVLQSVYQHVVAGETPDQAVALLG